eukprot:gene6224-8362_t
MGLLSDAHRAALTDPGLELPALRRLLAQLVDGLRDPAHPYHAIPTVAYALSKVGVNCHAQVLARQRPAMRVNACSPGFCNTG